jgi:acyl phosphate:glycerol-3-phosphate acyltransferase
MNYLLSVAVGYILGSFPTAYLILRKTRGIDITNRGSGNVGAYNSFEVSKSKIIGAIVLLIDALKGLLSVYLTLLFFPKEFIFPALALLAAVFSHCFNPWLNFKGGRGLATSAGGLLLLFPFLVILWVVIWFIIYLVKKNIIWSNIWSTIMSLIIIFTTNKIAVKYSFPRADTISLLILFSMSLLIIIFIKHIDPLKDLMKSKNIFKMRKNDE